MKLTAAIVILGSGLISFLCFDFCNTQTLIPNKTLQLVNSIPLSKVSGRIDHMTFDYEHQRIFVAALGNNSVEVLDLKEGKTSHSIKNSDEPQGLVFIHDNHSLFIASGGTGECVIYDADSWKKITSIKLADDADNVRYDSITKMIYVGYGDGGIAMIDAGTFSLISDIKLSGHPESFQIDADAKKIFVNVPDKRLIEVIDLEKKLVTERWKITDAGSNFPMSLDKIHHRIFIGCRHPAKMLVLDTQSGKMVTSVEIDGDVDDIFYDNSRKLIYLSCGSGYIDIVNQIDSDTYMFNSKVLTRSGARTSLFIPENDRFVVASPSGSGSGAALLVYEIK